MTLRAVLRGGTLAAALITVCALPALLGGFVYDDRLIAKHPLFDGVDDLVLAFSRTSHDYNADILDTTSGVTFRPLPVASLIASSLFFGKTPLPHHLVSLALHLSNCALIALLGFDARSRRVPAFWSFASLLFALHPLVAETYQWISGRNDLLAGTALAGLAVLLRARARGAAWTRRRVPFGLSCAALLAFGALCKETFLVAAGFLVLADLVASPAGAPAERRSPRARWSHGAPVLLGFAFAFALMRVLRAHAAASAAAARGAGSIVLDPGFWVRLPHVLALGLETLLVPAPRPMRALSWEFEQPWTAAQAAALALAIALALWMLRAKRWDTLLLLAGAGASLAPTAIVAGYFWLGFDRYLYLPLILLLAALAPHAPALQARIEARAAAARPALAVAAASLTAWFAYATWTTATFFAGNAAFAGALISARPADPSGYLIGAASVDASGRAAVAEYLRGLVGRDLPPAFVHAVALQQSRFGLYAEVKQTLERAAARFPDDAQVHFDLLELRGAQHRFSEGLALSKALLNDAHFCPATQAKLREWAADTALPDEIRQQLRSQLAASPCG